MPTLVYNIQILPSVKEYIPPKDIHIRKSEINSQKMIMVEDNRSNPFISKFGWNKPILPMQPFGSLMVSDSCFMRDGLRVPIGTILTVPLIDKRVYFDKYNLDVDVVILERKNGSIGVFKELERGSDLDYTSTIDQNDEDHPDEMENNKAHIYDPRVKGKKYYIDSKKNSFSASQLWGRDDVSKEEIESFGSTPPSTGQISSFEIIAPDRIIQDDNITTVKTRFFPVEAAAFFLDGSLISPASIDKSKGIAVFDRPINGQLRVAYTVNPVALIYTDTPILYEKQVHVDSELNFLEVNTEDVSIPVIPDTIQDLTPSDQVYLNIKSDESTFLEPDSPVVINGDVVIPAEKYQLPKLSSFSLSLPNNVFDLMTKLEEDSGSYMLTGYTPGTLAAFYGRFESEGRTSYAHISFNKKMPKSDEYLSGRINLSNGGLYTVIQTHTGLSITLDTSVSGNQIALPALALRNNVRVLKVEGEVELEYQNFDYRTPGVITVKDNGVFKIEYTPVLAPEETTVRIQNQKTQKSFAQALKDPELGLKEVYAIYSRTSKIKVGNMHNGYVSYLPEGNNTINFSSVIPERTLKAMVSESKNILF